MADAKTEKQKVQEITEKLEQGIKELFESEKYKTYLNTICQYKATEKESQQAFKERSEEQ